MGKRITVALDAMGGDYAPLETVKGAVDAVKELDVNIKLVGPAEQLHAELAKYQYDKERIEIVHASEVIGTDESPTMAIRRKKDSSLVVALNLVKNGEADAIVCDGFVGNTILKLSEGLAKTIFEILKGEIMQGFYKVGALILKTPFKNMKKFMDSDEIGGAPFIGLKSLVVKAHGSSNAKAFKNAVRQCVLFAEADIIGKIKDKI